MAKVFEERIDTPQRGLTINGIPTGFAHAFCRIYFNDRLGQWLVLGEDLSGKPIFYRVPSKDEAFQIAKSLGFNNLTEI